MEEGVLVDVFMRRRIMGGVLCSGYAILYFFISYSIARTHDIYIFMIPHRIKTLTKMKILPSIFSHKMTQSRSSTFEKRKQSYFQILHLPRGMGVLATRHGGSCQATWVCSQASWQSCYRSVFVCVSSCGRCVVHHHPRHFSTAVSDRARHTIWIVSRA